MSAQRQLKMLKSKMIGKVRTIPRSLHVAHINVYNQSLCNPMLSHRNPTEEEIQSYFSEYNTQCPTIDKEILSQLLRRLPNR